MDDTQRLDYNDDEEDTTGNRDRPAGNLHMFAGIHGPAQDFPIFRGQNIIGRHANCDITLPAQSVSKKHAILEVRGDCHTICDNGSLNKTRRGKVALAPDVHYALSDGDFLLFADVACRYTVQDKVETETTGVEDSEDDSVLVPPTQGALTIEKTPGAAIRRIARGAVLARDSGDEDEEEDRQTRRHEGGCGSFKDGLKTSSTGAIFPHDADTIVPESDEENDTSTSETHLPSLNLSADTDTSRRSSFVPCSQNISTPVVLKDQSKLSGRTLTAVDKEEMESRKPADGDMKLSLAVEDPPDGKKNRVETVESTSGGIVPEPPVELVGTTDDNVKKEQEGEKLLQEDALNKPSSESIQVSSPCDEDDNVTSSRSETVQEAPSESSPKTDASMQHNNVQLSDTDVNPKEDNVSSDRESDIQEDATKSGTGVNTAETSGIQSNKTEEDGNGGALGSGGAEFHMDSDTDDDDDDDEAATTGPDVEKAETHHVSEMKESENNENSVTGGNEGGSDSDTDVEDDLNVTKSKSDDEVNKTKDEPNTSEGTAGFGIDSDTDDDADMPKPAGNNAEQDSNSTNEENNAEQDSNSTNEENNAEQDSKSNNEENNAEQESKSNSEGNNSEQESKSNNEENNAEQDSKSTNEENNAEQDSKSTNEENNAEQDCKSTNKENNAEQDSKSNNEENNAEQDCKSINEENNAEQDCKSTNKENNAKQDSKSTNEENNAEQDSKSNTEEKKEEFHMDSDTDVEEDVSTAEVKETEPESSKTSAKDVFNLDSDTDVDEDVDVSSKDVMRGPQDSSTANTNVKEETGVDSDTDVDEDDQIPGGANVALGKNSTDEPKVVATEAAALHVDSDTDVDDDDVAPQGTTRADSAKTGSEMSKAEELHLDSDTDEEEDDAEEGKVDTGGVLEKAGADQESLSSTNEAAAVSGSSSEQTENVSAQIGTEDDETQKSESESIDLEMMPTQCFLEPQEEESDLQDEEATQAFILSSTWAEPDPFKRPADPIGVLQISSVTLDTSEEEIDGIAEAETQAFCSEAEPRGPSLQETPEPVERSVDETVLSSSSGEDSEKEVQQLPHEPVSQDATQPVSQCLSGRPPQETGNWVHLKRDVPASVWIRGIQHEGDSTDLEGSKEAAEDETQAYDQSLNLELEATQSYVEESPSLPKSPLHTDAPAVPTVEEGAEPDVPSEKVEQSCSEDTQESDATQPYSPSPTGPGVDNGTTQASAGDDATQAVSILPVDTEDNDTQVVTPSVPAAEEIVPETSTTKNKEKLSLRRGLSRSKKKEEPAQNIQTSSITEEPHDKGSVGPGSLSAEPDQQSTGKPQSPEPEIKEVQVEKEVRRQGGRRIAESQDKDTAKEEVPVAATSRKRTSKLSSEDEPSTSGVSEQSGTKQDSRESTIKEVNEELKEERKQSSSNTEEINEVAATEILPVNPPDEIESVSSVDDKKGTAVQQISEDSRDQASLENKDILCTEAPVSSTVIESGDPMEANDNSAEKEPDSHQDKKPVRNKRRVATRLKSEADKEEDKEENIDHNIKTPHEKDTSKQTSKPLQTQQEESQGRKATRKSCVKPSEQDSDEVEDTTGTSEENKKAEEVGPASQASGNENSKRTRKSLKEDVKEESENVQEGKGKTKRSTSVKDAEPKHEEKGNEDMPESDKRPKRTKNNSKKDATKPEEVKEDVKTEENESVTKPTRGRKNIKEQQKPEDNVETQETSNSDVQTSRRTRRELQGEDKIVKEETVKETTSRRTRRHSMEEEAVKLEDQTKKSRRTIKDSREETKTKETVDESPPDNKQEAVERKATRTTRKSVKDDETSVCEKETKQTEQNSKPERSSRTRAKSSDKSKESHEDVEDVNKGTEESHKLSPQEEMSKPTGGRGRRAAKKEDKPQVTTPVASSKQEQATKASDRSKELHEDVEGITKGAEESHKLSPLEETSKPAGGRGRRAVKKDDVSQVSTPVTSRKREQATKASDKSKALHENIESVNKGAEESHKLSPQEEASKPTGGRGRRAAKKDDVSQVSTPVTSRKREQATKASDKSKELHEDVEGITKGAEESHKLSPQEETSKPAGGRGRRAAKKDDVSQISTPVASRKREQATKASDKSKELHEDVEGITKGAEESHKLSPQEETSKPAGGRGRRAAKKDDVSQVSTPVASRKREQATKASDKSKELHENVESVNKGAEESHKLSPQEEASKPTGGRGRRAAKKDDVSHVSTPVASRKREQATKASDKSKELHEDVESITKGAEESHKLSPQEETSKPAGGRGRRAAKKDDVPQVSTPVSSRKREQTTIKAEVEVKRKKSDEGEDQEEPREVETPKRPRGRPRKQDTQQTPTRKDVTPPDPSPSRDTRKRPSSAFTNSPEVSTPRRTNRMSTPAPATRLAQSVPAPKILFTGVVDTAGEETIRSLGGDIAKSVFDCTHLVTDRVRRTVKFLCALARGIPIVTLDWIDKCKKSGCFLSPTGFLVHDKEQEKNFNFLLSESLQKAKKSPLFEGYEIHVTANVKPDPDQMKDIICCSGASFLPKMPRTFKEKCVIVSCPEDAARCKSVPASVPITSAEFILSGILRQEVNPTAYLLSPPDTGPTPAKRRR